MNTSLSRLTVLFALTCTLFLGAPLIAHATTTVPNTLSGTVYDLSTGDPMGGVEVRLYDASQAWAGSSTPASIATTVTAPDGTYTITGINGNTYTVIAFVDLTGNYRDNTADFRGFHVTDSFGWLPDMVDEMDGYMLPLDELAAWRAYRVDGLDRYETAAAISLNAFAGADDVIIANGSAFADSLSAASLAGMLDCPLLLVQKDKIPASTREEIMGLGAQNAYIVGGTASVSGAVEKSLAGMGLKRKRIGGADRYAVAANVARYVYDEYYKGDPSGFPGVYVCRGDVFADALSVSPFAFDQVAPILLTDPKGLPSSIGSVFNYMTADSGQDTVAIAGGTVSVPQPVVQQLADRSATGGVSYTRMAGKDRYSTGRAVIETHMQWYRMKGFDSIAVASGEVFPDALAGGMAQGHWDGALVLTPGASLGSDARKVLGVSGPYIIDLPCLGGPVTLADSTIASADRALGTSVYDIDASGERVSVTGVTAVQGTASSFTPRRGFEPPTLPRVSGEGAAPTTAPGFGGDALHFLQATP